LLYGEANAEFNALLEVCERLTDEIRSRLRKTVQIAEFRFERLIEANKATTYRCPWIGNYREMPRTLVQVEKNAADLFKFIAKARSEANALSITQRKEQAEAETHAFLTSARSLTHNVGGTLKLTFNSKQAVASPGPSIENVTAELKKAEEEDTATRNAEIQKKLDKKMEELVSVAAETDNKEYLLKLFTSKKLGSGTDCDIALIISGTLGRTEMIKLLDEDKTKFEKGRLDQFEIEIDGDIGEVKQITLGLLGLEDPVKATGADWGIGNIELIERGQNGNRQYAFDSATEAKLTKRRNAQDFAVSGVKVHVSESHQKS